MAFELETKEIGDVATLESVGSSSANREMCSPAVALETATAYFAPV